jgi:dUTP pyrophosphatase
VFWYMSYDLVMYIALLIYQHRGTTNVRTSCTMPGGLRHKLDCLVGRVPNISMVDSYILEIVVTELGVPFYPSVGTVESRTDDNAGYDLKVVQDVQPSVQPTLAPLGVRARLLKQGADVHFTLEPRSSIYKSGFMMANSRGIIDKSYRGELKAPVICVGDASHPKSIEAGTRLFQILAPDLGWIREVRYVSSLPDTVRGEGGFGSTGAK